MAVTVDSNIMWRKAFWEELRNSYPDSPLPELQDYKQFAKKIFFSTSGDGKRVRYDFWKLFPDFDRHEVETPYMLKDFPPKFYLFLSKTCERPYYIGNHNIIFVDENEAFTFKLCDGDIDTWRAVES